MNIRFGDRLEEELLEYVSDAIYKVLPNFDNNLTDQTWEEIKVLVAKIVQELNQTETAFGRSCRNSATDEVSKRKGRNEHTSTRAIRRGFLASQ